MKKKPIIQSISIPEKFISMMWIVYAYLERYPRMVSSYILFLALLGMIASCDPSFDEIVDVNTEIQNEQSSRSESIAVTANMLVSGLEGSSGSTIGPGKKLYVTEGAAGRISRIDVKKGDVSEYVSGLPLSPTSIGGVIDVVFLDEEAYALVTLVDDPNFFPTGQINGIYRIDGPSSFTVIADIGAFNLAHPPTGFDYFISTGVSYAIDTYRDGFLVTDGHFNRVLYITEEGEISIFKSFGNIVPTGLEVSGKKVLMSEAGPLPHLPQDGKVISFDGKSSLVDVVATGAPLLVDVEYGRGRTLYALSQGIHSSGSEGTPADPNTGSLVRINEEGTFTIIFDGLNIPTSLEFIKNTAYVITLTGEVWEIHNVDDDHHSNHHRDDDS